MSIDWEMVISIVIGLFIWSIIKAVYWMILGDSRASSKSGSKSSLEDFKKATKDNREDTVIFNKSKI